ncbi:MAG: EAL domain-containing protein, partial [Pseudomonadota bacterium]
ERKRNIVAAMISLAETLQFKVIAEGVETPAQHELLRSLGCPYAQGFLFGKPEPRHAVLARLEAEAGAQAQAQL